jgi:hypothetical protein
MFKTKKLLKILPIIALVLIILIFLNSFAFYNIKISEKYEVDLLGTYYEVNHLSKDTIIARKLELAHKLKNTKTELISLTSLLILTAIAFAVFSIIDKKAKPKK